MLELVIGLLALAAALWTGQHYRAKRRRRGLLQSPLKPEWLVLLKDRVPLYATLPEDAQQRLQGCINYFLAEKVFVGCSGFEINDTVRLSIAGNACLLVFNRDQPYFTGFRSILVYPETYVAHEVEYDGPVEIHGESVRAGESWHRGPVILSWRDITEDAEHRDGQNVILHEFAHKLDEENDSMDGLPVLRNNAHYREWARVLTQEYASFVENVERGEHQVMDEYGAVSAAEFFAVATEAFFEKPRAMHDKLPELYRQLKLFYGLDPAGW